MSHELVSVPKWLPMAAMHPVDYYSTFTKNCSGDFTEEEIKSIRAFYYAMCAEADAMLGSFDRHTLQEMNGFKDQFVLNGQTRYLQRANKQEF